jgi:hypothetical protein
VVRHALVGRGHLRGEPAPSRVETQRQWSDLAIQRTTPLLLGLFSLVALWASELAVRAGRLLVLGAAWYKNPEPTFSDCLATVRRVLWAEEAVRPIL